MKRRRKESPVGGVGWDQKKINTRNYGIISNLPFARDDPTCGWLGGRGKGWDWLNNNRRVTYIDSLSLLRYVWLILMSCHEQMADDLTEEQSIEFQEAFKKFDKDDKDAIATTDFSMLMESFGVKMTEGDYGMDWMTYFVAI